MRDKQFTYFSRSYNNTPSLEAWWYDEKYRDWSLELLYFKTDDKYVRQDTDEYFGMLVYPDEKGFNGVEITDKEFHKLIGGYLI